MTFRAQELVLETRRVVGLQLLIAILVAAGFFVAQGPGEALAAAYGGLVSVVSTLLLSRGIRKAGTVVARGEKKKSEVILYGGAAMRFLVVLACFGVGLAILELAPLAMVAGFVTVQMVFVFTARRMRQQGTP